MYCGSCRRRAVAHERLFFSLVYCGSRSRHRCAAVWVLLYGPTIYEVNCRCITLKFCASKVHWNKVKIKLTSTFWWTADFEGQKINLVIYLKCGLYIVASKLLRYYRFKLKTVNLLIKNGYKGVSPYLAENDGRYRKWKQYKMEIIQPCWLGGRASASI